MVVIQYVDGAFRNAMAFGGEKAWTGVDACIGENYIDAVVLPRDLVESGGHPGAIGYVDNEAPDITALRFEPGHHRGEPLIVQIKDANARAVLSHDLGIRLSDSAGAARHNDRLAFDVEHVAKRRHQTSPFYKPPDRAHGMISQDTSVAHLWPFAGGLGSHPNVFCQTPRSEIQTVRIHSAHHIVFTNELPNLRTGFACFI
jgi:hypothetical protein